MRVNAALSFDPIDTPLQDQQLAALNRALTAEVLRHAETRQALRVALTLCWFRERMEPVEVVREVPTAVAAPERSDTSHWTVSPRRQRALIKFPLAIAERTGLAAVIRRPLILRSGAVLDPANIAVRRGSQTFAIPDSSWLVLSAMARQPGEFVTRGELEQAVFGREGSDSVRSAIHRARLTLGSVEAESDIEATRVANAGRWRLMLAETP